MCALKTISTTFSAKQIFLHLTESSLVLYWLYLAKILIFICRAFGLSTSDSHPILILTIYIFFLSLFVTT